MTTTPSQHFRWMIYGANGYSGALIAQEAVKRGYTPVLAGRRADNIAPLAGQLGLEYQIFGLDDTAQLQQQLQGFQLVMHCAGPFSATAAPMMQACTEKLENRL